MALDLVHRLIGRGHRENDQLAQLRGQRFLRVDLAVDEPRLDGRELRVRDAQVRVCLTV